MLPLNRRQFLRTSFSLGAAFSLSPLLGACRQLEHFGIPITLYLPGMQAGHALRGNTPYPAPTSERRVKVAILGSGAAGLFAAWRLKKSDHFNQAGDVLIVSGPELHGNAAAGDMANINSPNAQSAASHSAAANKTSAETADSRAETANPREETIYPRKETIPPRGETIYPRGAHYLPLPSMASAHVRELLFEMGVIEANPYDEQPTYSETALIHSPEDRLLIKGHWQDGVVPHTDVSTDDLAQQQRFFAYVQQLEKTIGSDGRKVFSIPLSLSSTDVQWRALDQISFAQWLSKHGYTAPSLLWYLDYACRDDYGIGADQTSAWAGLHYFASRGGQMNSPGLAEAMKSSRNDDKTTGAGAVLTWPNGLNPLLQHLQRGQTLMNGMAVKIAEHGQLVHVDVFDAVSGKTTRIIADYVICAMPLHVAAKITDLTLFGFDPKLHLAPHAAWQVSNFLLNRFPAELAHTQQASDHSNEQTPLAWDNVVYGSSSLGYVHSTHQLIRVAKPAQTVFTAYHAYAGESPITVRQRLEHASADELYAIAIKDLDAAYGWSNSLKARRYIQHVEITLRGHAMASPIPGFLSNAGVAALQQLSGNIQFAHSDLSGLSVFEEASWWGEQAAQKIIRQQGTQ